MDGLCEDGSYTGWDWDLPYSGMSGGTGATKMVVVIIGAVVVGTAVGVGTSVDVGVAGMDTVVGAVFVGMGSGQGLGVCVSGAFVSASVIPAGAGVWVAVASGVRELAGNAVVAVSLSGPAGPPRSRTGPVPADGTTARTSPWSDGDAL